MCGLVWWFSYIYINGVYTITYMYGITMSPVRNFPKSVP